MLMGYFSELDYVPVAAERERDWELDSLPCIRDEQPAYASLGTTERRSRNTTSEYLENPRKDH